MSFLHPLNTFEVYWVSIPQQAQIRNIASGYAYLDEQERQTYDAYRVDFKKLEFMTGRVLLKKLLAQKMHLKPEEIIFSKNSFGKPFLDKRHANVSGELPFQFNLSHTDQMVACIIGLDALVGIDVETTKRTHLELMKSVFTRDEIEYVNAKQWEHEQNRAFCEIWTRKEAYVKAVGKGFSISPATFSVPFGSPQFKDKECWYYSQVIEERILSIAVYLKEAEPVFLLNKINFEKLYSD